MREENHFSQKNEANLSNTEEFIFNNKLIPTA